VYKSALKILKTKIGIETNRKELLPNFPLKTEVKSLLTDFHDVKKILYDSDLDGEIIIHDREIKPIVKFLGQKAILTAPFLRLVKNASDLRFSLWGNQGFLYRYTLYLLEKKHRVYNLHACALYHKEKGTMFVIAGGAGSGKSVYLLSGLSHGLKLFSTETAHITENKGIITFYMGSLIDNVRLETLLFHYPQFLPDLDIPESIDYLNKKIALDFSSYKEYHKEIINPNELHILFPRIEKGQKKFILNPITDSRKAAKVIFDNISQKITETFLIYDNIPVLGFDEKNMALERLNFANRLVQHESIKNIATVLSNPEDCWGNLLE